MGPSEAQSQMEYPAILPTEEEEEESFRENKKLFWKQVNEVRKEKHKMERRINDKDGMILNEKERVQCRWGEYFEDLLNNSDDREAVVTTLGMGGLN